MHRKRSSKLLSGTEAKKINQAGKPCVRAPAHMISESEGGQPVVQGGHRAAAGLVSGSPEANKALIGGCLVRRVMSGRGGFRLCHRAMF